MKQIRLTKGLFALVEDEDFDWLNKWKWCASNESRGTKWYAIRREKGRKVRMHVEVVKRRLGLKRIPKGQVVDHINHNSLDNRCYIWEPFETPEGWSGLLVLQLEIVTQAENMRRSVGWKKKK